MKRAILIAAVVLFSGSAAFALTIVGSKHDLKAALPTSQQVCVFCHTPHQPGAQTTDPLWNHNLSATATYQVYSSLTLNAVPTDIGGGTAVSNLCMSCHDGTVGIGRLYNNPNISTGEEVPTNLATIMPGNANMGTDLTNDHPVNFAYNAALVTADGGLANPAIAPVLPLLFGGMVQCASCHDVHDPALLPFLRISNVNSQLCTTCHIK